MGEWLFDTVAGIGLDPKTPAYKHILIHPRPGGGLTYAKAEFQSIHGRIVSDWKIEDGQFRLNVVIPANTTAEVFLPGNGAEMVKEGNKPATQAEGVKFLRVEDGNAVFAVGSGSYEFSSPASALKR